MPIDLRKTIAFIAATVFVGLVFNNVYVVIMVLNSVYVVSLILRKATGARIGREYWLVPGGIIGREGMTAGAGETVQLFTAQNASLIVDFTGQTSIHVVIEEPVGEEVRRQVLWIPLRHSGCLAALAAWRSTSNPPTLGQVKTLMGAA